MTLTTTNKGYALTPGQQARYAALTQYADIGPGYVRAVRDNLTRCAWAEDHTGVDYFLTHAEACVPGSPEITETIPTVEP